MALPVQGCTKRVRGFLKARGPQIFGTTTAVICAVCMVLDVAINNWDLNDYIGNAKTFFTPVLTKVASANDLKHYFSFPTDASPYSVSSAGRFILNHSLAAIHAREKSHYFLAAGSFVVLDKVNDICRHLADVYPVPPGAKTTQLGHVLDELVHVRGPTLYNLFMGPSPPPPAGSNAKQLAELGYRPARVDADMRLTTAIPIPTHGVVVRTNLSMYRFNARSFCTGCLPIMEMGVDRCTVQIQFNATTQVLTVQSSKPIYGQKRALGMMLSRSNATTFALWVRFTCVVYLVVSFSTSRKTVRWTNRSTLSTWYEKLGYMVSPTLYRYPSNAFSLSFMSFNSDVFVGLYLVAVLLDETSSAVFARSLYRWNKGANDSFVVLRLWSINIRMLWFNCFVLKVLKRGASLVSTARHTGANHVVGFFNFSSVTCIYFASIFLLQRDKFTDFINADYTAVDTRDNILDGLSVNFFESWFVRTYTGQLVALVINLIVVLCLDHAINRSWWRNVAQNSLGRQLMFNTTAIVSDLGYKFIEVPNYDGKAISLHVRALCTVHWYLSCFTLKFGLPEHHRKYAAMKFSKKSAAMEDGHSRKTVGDRNLATMRRYFVRSAPDCIPEDEAGGGSHDKQRENSAMFHEMYLLCQDDDGNISLCNHEKDAVQVLSMEVKIMADALYTVA
ncbi:hypothetical protein DYB32_009048 [Aphanomyces invadans]|uniref:Uncharacterized protein n=1 Tax=Aphanomyces invadans TaxID=157072 RepID=A0A418AJL8_9STRA|nr:hypothetical protein DYB32_009048 [Aphanomyces invadans]